MLNVLSHDAFAAPARGSDPADGCRLAGAPANRDLVMLDAFLVDAENADIGGMVVSAGVDAAGNIQAQRADLDASRGIFKPFEYPVRHGQGPGVRKIAVIKTRTGDHVTDQAFLGIAETRDCQTFDLESVSTPPSRSRHAIRGHVLEPRDAAITLICSQARRRLYKRHKDEPNFLAVSYRCLTCRLT